MTNLLALVVLWVGCGGSGTPKPDETGTLAETGGTGETGSLVDTGPCDPGPTTLGTDTELSLDHDGEARTFIVRVPASYDCTPLPVVIGVHGYYGTGYGFEHLTAGMSDHMETQGYIGLFPDGLPMSEGSSVTSFNDLGSRNDDGPDGQTCTDSPWNYGSYDNCGPDERARTCHWGTSCADDEGFFRAMLELAGSYWALDSSRIYMTGFSQGGQTTQSMGCPMSDVLAAIAPIHGFATNGYTCAPETTLGMLQVWGTSDSTVPGTGTASDGYIYDEADETLAEWAVGQGCSSVSTTYTTESDGTQGWVCVQQDACTTGAEVVSCSWSGNHTWPSTGADGNFILNEIWTFFEAHQKEK